MLRFLSLLAALAATACAPPVAELPILQPSAVKLEPGETYVVVTLEDESAFVGRYGMCETTSQSYELKTNLLCSGDPRSLFFGQAENLVIQEDERVRLSDGTLVRFMDVDEHNIWALKKLGASGSFILTGRFLIRDYLQRIVRAEPLTGQVPIYDLVPGKVHYLGHVSGNDSIVWRSPDALAEQLNRDIPGLGPGRLMLAEPKIATVDCEVRSTAKCRFTVGQ